MKPKLSRRALLRGAGGAALALPLLESMKRSVVRGDIEDGLVNGQIKRFVTVFIGNGVYGNRFFPQQDSFLDCQMAPLEPFRSRTLVLDGMTMRVAREGVGENHQRGMGAVLTGRQLQDTGEFRGGNGALAGWADGVSLDQSIADRIRGNTRLKSLQLGVVANHRGSEVRSRMCYRGPADPISPIDNPREAFDLLFSGFDAGESEAANAIKAKRQRIVDAVQDQYAEVKRRVSSTDRQRLDRHLTFIDELESRIDGLGASTLVCTPPDSPRQLNVSRFNDAPEISRAQIDLLVSSFACDLTRVGNLQYSTASHNFQMPWLNDNENGHGLGHKCSRHNEAFVVTGDPVRTQANQKWARRIEWYMNELRYLAEQLDSVQDGDGTLLDSTAILLTSDISNPQHGHDRMPFVIIGNAGGALQSGVRRFGGGNSRNFVNHNRMLIALAQAYGIDTDVFGDPRFCDGGALSEILS